MGQSVESCGQGVKEVDRVNVYNMEEELVM